jgi:hypothetical protein
MGVLEAGEEVEEANCNNDGDGRANLGNARGLTPQAWTETTKSVQTVTNGKRLALQP